MTVEYSDRNNKWNTPYKKSDTFCLLFGFNRSPHGKYPEILCVWGISRDIVPVLTERLGGCVWLGCHVCCRIGVLWMGWVRGIWRSELVPEFQREFHKCLLECNDAFWHEKRYVDNVEGVFEWWYLFENIYLIKY